MVMQGCLCLEVLANTGFRCPGLTLFEALQNSGSLSGSEGALQLAKLDPPWRWVVPHMRGCSTVGCSAVWVL